FGLLSGGGTRHAADRDEADDQSERSDGNADETGDTGRDVTAHRGDLSRWGDGGQVTLAGTRLFVIIVAAAAATALCTRGHDDWRITWSAARASRRASGVAGG